MPITRSTSLLTTTFFGLCLLTGCPDSDDDAQTNKGGWNINQDDMGSPDQDMMTMPDQAMMPDQGTMPDVGVDSSPDMPVVNEPNLVTLTEVNFARVVVGNNATRSFDITNGGGQDLLLTDMVLSPVTNVSFSVSFPDPDAPDDLSRDRRTWPPSLEPGRSFPVRITYSPNNELPTTAKLFVESNDPDTPQTAITLNGNRGGPCVTLAGVSSLTSTFDYLLDFGSAQIGRNNEKTITIENCSRTETLIISDVLLNDDGGGTFAISEGLTAGSPLVIAPGQTDQVKVSYTPTSMRADMGELELRTNDIATSKVSVQLKGSGGNNTCPTAVAEGTIIGSTGRPATRISTVPLKTMQLGGAMSVDPDGAIARYEWVILSQPSGSTTRLTPSNVVEDPKLFIDLAGVYTLELTVYDNSGLASCQAAIITIVAIPDEDISVELVWDTPMDTDQTDMFGSDLDLHYMRSGGTWDNRTYDVYWKNPEGDWGIAGDPSDNPSLDIDDTDGKGPEVINHNNPSVDVYSVGVYYYSDNGFGSSYATTRIYVQGQILHEATDKFLQNDNIFWHVGNITVATNMSTTYQTIDRITSGFPR